MPTVKTAEGSKVVVAKLDAGVASDAKTAIDELKSKHGVTKLDIVSGPPDVPTPRVVSWTR